MAKITIFCFAMAMALCYGVLSKPVDNESLVPEVYSDAASETIEDQLHRIAKRFIDSAQTFGEFADKLESKMRTKRSSEGECEKLRLCKLHAQSSRNFFAAYELYFVNKENARLWDHHARSIAECDQRFSGCFE